MVYICEFEFFEDGKYIDAFPCGELGGGATFGENLEDAVESAADFLAMTVDDHLMNRIELPPMSFGHKPEHGGKIIAIAVTREASA